MLCSLKTAAHSRNRMARASAVAAFLFCAGMLWSRTVQAEPADVINTNATIHVTVADEPDVSGDFMVDSTGNITMLYVNQIAVRGLTVPQASRKIATALSKYIKNPQVLVRIVNVGGIFVDVTGSVTAPGSRVVRADSTLDDVLQQLNPAVDADLSHVTITHGKPNSVHTTDTINYLSYLNSKDPAGNPHLQDYDVVNVPRKEIPISISVRGQVLKPGRADAPSNTTVFDAIQIAGGLTDSANRKSIYLQRADSTVHIPFDLKTASEQPGDISVNPVLRDGDSVVVDALPAPSVYTLTGGVLRPSEYPLTERTSLADAVGRAGGFAAYAKENDTQIIRTDPLTGKSQIIKVKAGNPSILASTFVQPGDNISIPQGSPGRDTLTLVSTLLGIATAIYVLGTRR